MQEHTDVVSSVAFSPDGKLLATGSWDNTAKLWDLSSGQCINTLKVGGLRSLGVDWTVDDKSTCFITNANC